MAAEAEAFDPRVVRLGIEIGGQLKWYDGLNVRARGSKSANALQGDATITVANLDRDTRNEILTATSPYSRDRRRKQVFLDAGRVGMGVFRVFQGDITSASVSQPPDIEIEIAARICQFYKGEIIARSYPTTNLSVIARGVAKDLGLALVFEATDRKVANYSFTGAALQQVEQLEQVGGVDAFVDDERLVVKDRAVALKNITHTLSETSGLVGIPEVTDSGVSMTLLLVPGVQIGGQIELESKMNPALSGKYSIYQLDFDITSRETSFYWTAHCWRPGVAFFRPDGTKVTGNPATQKS
jgi:hypothetical protein